MVIIKTLILLFTFLFCFLCVLSIFYSLIASSQRVKKRIDYFLNSDKTKNVKVQDKNIKKSKFNTKNLKNLNKHIGKRISTSNHEEIDQILISAGLDIDAEDYLMSKWVIAAILGGIIFFIFNNFIFLFVGGLCGYFIPNMWIKRKIKARIEKFNTELPNMINIIIGSLRSGYSFPQALKTVVEECDSPIKEEMGILLKEMSYGITMDEALNNLNKRMPSDDLELLIQSILIQRQVGGNLAGILEIIVNTIRERIRIQRQVQTLTSQGRLSGRVIGGLPIILGFAIYLINPEYIELLFTNTIGIILICISAFSGIIGFILINKLTKIEV